MDSVLVSMYNTHHVYVEHCTVYYIHKNGYRQYACFLFIFNACLCYTRPYKMNKHTNTAQKIPFCLWQIANDEHKAKEFKITRNKILKKKM